MGLLDKIQSDLRDSTRGRVLYVEGPSDLPALLALLGRPDTLVAGDRAVVDGALIRHLAGAGAVRQMLETFTESALPVRGWRVWGVLDGDGRSRADLAATFDPPARGPLFTWKAYCIESLLARAGWPPAWGPPPDWAKVMRAYSAYVALNRLHQAVQDDLLALGIARHTNPIRGGALLTREMVTERLSGPHPTLQAPSLVARFEEELAAFEALLDARDLDEAHCRLNGKWLVEHWAPDHAPVASADQARAAWCAHVGQAGGDPEIKAFWARFLD